jgi:Ca-activated chloride channel family protein
MKQRDRISSSHRSRRADVTLTLLALLLFLAAPAGADVTRLLLARGQRAEGEYKGTVELTVDPGFDAANVELTVDGQPLDALRSPYKVTVDFGPSAVEHRIGISARSLDGARRVQWKETLHEGRLPLGVKVRAVDAANRLFEAEATAPDDDPVQAVEFWDAGVMLASIPAPPYRFTIPTEHFGRGIVQVTAKTKSGDEVADFWSASGDLQVASLDVRTVPLFVSVVDRNGQTRTDVDASLFRIIDNQTEAKILEFRKAFDQPISIALLLDSSASMTYELPRAAKAAESFVERMLEPADRCAVFAVRSVPRRLQELTSDKALVQKALASMEAGGQTALYDAIAGAIRELRDEKNRRAIVVLTDGGDTSSNIGFDEIDKAATEAGVPIYFIAYESGEATDRHEVDRMNYLAGQTGGFVASATQQNLQAKYAEIEKDLRAQYAIVYQISDFAKHNEWRKVRVMLRNAQLNARTIRGYFAP